jgi:hypothetical protein
MHDSKLILCFLVDIALSFSFDIIVPECHWDALGFTLRTDIYTLRGYLGLVNDWMFHVLLLIRDRGRHVRDAVDFLASIVINSKVLVLGTDRT